MAGAGAAGSWSASPWRRPCSRSARNRGCGEAGGRWGDWPCCGRRESAVSSARLRIRGLTTATAPLGRAQPVCAIKSASCCSCARFAVTSRMQSWSSSRARSLSRLVNVPDEVHDPPRLAPPAHTCSLTPSSRLPLAVAYSTRTDSMWRRRSRRDSGRTEGSRPAYRTSTARIPIRTRRRLSSDMKRPTLDEAETPSLTCPSKQTAVPYIRTLRPRGMQLRNLTSSSTAPWAGHEVVKAMNSSTAASNGGSRSEIPDRNR